MSATLSPMTGMGSNGMGIGGGGSSIPMPMLMAMMQQNSQPAMATPMSGMIQHTPPMAGATPGPAMMPQQAPQQQQGMSSMLPAIMQMLGHSGGAGASGSGGPSGPGLLGFLTGNQSGVVPQGVPGGMPTSPPATTESTGGVGGFLSLPGILRMLNPNYAGPTPGGGAF